MNTDFIFQMINILLQLGLLVVAVLALNTWKKELKGKDKYIFAKKRLERFKKIAFLIFKQGSLCQIYLNDLLTSRKEFYENLDEFSADEEVLVDSAYFKLTRYLDLETRADLFITPKIRELVIQIMPGWMKNGPTKSGGKTYMEIKIHDNFDCEDPLDDDKNRLFTLSDKQKITYKEYFLKWEELLKELQKNCT